MVGSEEGGILLRIFRKSDLAGGLTFHCKGHIEMRVVSKG